MSERRGGVVEPHCSGALDAWSGRARLLTQDEPPVRAWLESISCSIRVVCRCASEAECGGPVRTCCWLNHSPGCQCGVADEQSDQEVRLTGTEEFGSHARRGDQHTRGDLGQVFSR